MATLGEVIRVGARYTSTNCDDGMNIFWFRIDQANPSDGQVVTDMDNFLTTSWFNPQVALHTAATVLIDALVDVVDPVTGLIIRTLGTAFVNVAGNASGDMGTAAPSAWLQGDTGIPNVVGSKYVPFIAESAYSNNGFTAAAQTIIVAILNAYLQDFVSALTIYQPGVRSTKLNSFVPFNTAGAFAVEPAYQRRRKLAS